MAAIWLATARCHGGRITIRPSVGHTGPSIARDGDDETLPRTDLALEPKNWPDWLATRADAAGIPLPKANGANKDQARNPVMHDGVDIVGLAKLTPHGARPWTGPLTPVASKEGELLEEIYHYPALS